jgi:tetratricopeptide (TPR) repeat protein
MLALLLVSSAQAAGDARALYRQGQYEQAIATASAENSAGGFALAARAAMAEAMMRSPCLDCLKRAESLARKSVSMDGGLADGHVYLATSLGYQARIIGMIRARLAGYVEEAKTQLDEALRRDPQNPWALAALGGWHVEIVRGGGATLARWLYGASVPAGFSYFEKAFKAAPDNIVLRYQYALSLGGLDPVLYRSAISNALMRADSGAAVSAYDSFAQKHARELLTALKSGDQAAFSRVVRRDQGYP